MSPLKNASDKTSEKTSEKNRTNHAKQALREATQRKQAFDKATKNSASEKNGRGGLDPARFGDWEVKGIASDF